MRKTCTATARHFTGVTKNKPPPPGHGLGYEHTFVHAVADFVNACADGKPVQPTFEDGLKNQRVLTAVEKSSASGKWVKV